MKFKVPKIRTIHAMPGEPGVRIGPEWLFAEGRGSQRNGPRLSINGRWVSAVRGSSILYLRRWYRREHVNARAKRLESLRFRIGERLGRWSDLPF